MPTRKTKRTNWKQETLKLRRILDAKYSQLSALELDRNNERAKATFYETQCEAAVKRAESAERHNAELLRERDMWESANKTVCPGCFRHKCRGECMRAVKSWLRRNWVELVAALIVLLPVLGAIAFIVWRAWH